MRAGIVNAANPAPAPPPPSRSRESVPSPNPAISVSPRGGASGRRVLLWRVCATGYAAFLLWQTLWAHWSDHLEHPRNLVPGRTIAVYLGPGKSALERFVNLGGNLLAFVPIGILGATAPFLSSASASGLGRRAGTIRGAVAGFGFSLVVELGQAALGTRVADVDDLVLNTMGGAFGGWLVGARGGARGLVDSRLSGSSAERLPSDSDSLSSPSLSPFPERASP